jgi:adenosylcobinamide-GDP ribazoletransferase
VRRAIAFLTPIGGSRSPTATTLLWFPLAGAVIGAVIGGVWWLAGRWWPPLVAGALAVAADLALTGMLHFDGLADSADGLLPHMPQERRLEVMRKPDIGGFGVTAAGAVLFLRWSLLASIHPSVILIAALWCASRTLMASMALVMPYARRGGGLASAFLPEETMGGSGVAVAGLGLAAAAGLAAFWKPVPGPLAVAAAAVGAVGVAALAQRRLGGFTGDVLGAAGVIAETVGLLVAAAKW